MSKAIDKLKNEYGEEIVQKAHTGIYNLLKSVRPENEPDRKLVDRLTVVLVRIVKDREKKNK